VIDVGLDGTKEPFSLKTRGPKDNYIALSYCWGESSNIIKTTHESLDSHKNEIKFSTLPWTIRDAADLSFYT